MPGAECEAERDTLAADPNLLAFEANYTAEFDAATDACTAGLEQGDFTCDIDEDTFPTTPPYIAACTTAGGVIYERDIKVTCQFKAGDQSETLRVGFLKHDFCESDLCDVETVIADGEELTQEANILEAELEAELEALGDSQVSVDCEIASEIRDPDGKTIFEDGGSSSTTTTVTTLFLMTTAAAFAVW